MLCHFIAGIWVSSEFGNLEGPGTNLHMCGDDPETVSHPTGLGLSLTSLSPHPVQTPTTSPGCHLGFWPTGFRSKVLIAPSLGLINLLEWLTELGTFYLLDYGFLFFFFLNDITWEQPGKIWQLSLDNCHLNNRITIVPRQLSSK